MKRLTFYPDDAADPLWDADSPECHVSLDSLELRDDTRQAIRSWCRRWAILTDRTVWARAIEDGMADGTPNPVSRNEWDIAEREGRELFERIRSELGPDWSVEWDLQVPD